MIRHAEPDYSIDSLTPKGRVEAELLSRRLIRVAREEEILGMYVSPLGRARETADYTLRPLNREAEILPWLREFRGTGYDPDQKCIRNCWDLKPRTWHAHPLLGDPDHFLEDPLYMQGNVAEIWRETREGVDELLRRHGYHRDGPVYRCDHNTKGVIMLFCHFAIGMAVMACLTRMSPVPLWQNTLMVPSSVTTLITEERVQGEVSFRCVQLGDISHLYAAGERWSTAGLFPECYDGRDSTDPPEWGSRA